MSPTPASAAQRGQPSVFGRFIRIRNSVLARPAWLIFARSAKVKLTPEQLVDWFVTVNPQFPSEFRGEWLRKLESPPDGAKRSDIVAGMRQGINDTLAMLDCRTDSEIHRMERALAVKGLPSIRKMGAILKKKHQHILARGHIKDDEEFYIVAEVLSGLEFGLSESDRAQLARISYAYETREK